VASVHKRTILTEQPPLVGQVSAMDPYGLILGFIDRSHYFFFQVAPQLYSWGWVDPQLNWFHFYLLFEGGGGNFGLELITSYIWWQRGF
jgi:hypothetical protein